MTEERLKELERRAYFESDGTPVVRGEPINAAMFLPECLAEIRRLQAELANMERELGFKNGLLDHIEATAATHKELSWLEVKE